MNWEDIPPWVHDQQQIAENAATTANHHARKYGDWLRELCKLIIDSNNRDLIPTAILEWFENEQYFRSDKSIEEFNKQAMDELDRLKSERK